MTLIDRLLIVATAFAEARKLSLSRVSTIVFGDGKVLGRLKGSADLTTGRYEAGMKWFDENWPEGVEWPAEVPKPLTLERFDAAFPGAPTAEQAA